jgi:hypothetical protein
VSYGPKDLREAFVCIPKEGKVFWKVRNGVSKTFNTKFAGKLVGSINRGGYLCTKLTLSGVANNLQVHRIVWALSGKTPAFPEKIDHIDGNRLNNRISNLRATNSRLNAQNQRQARADNKIGLLGIHACKNRFRACIRNKGKLIHVGYFSTAKDAHDAYVLAKRQLHEHGTL